MKISHFLYRALLCMMLIASSELIKADADDTPKTYTPLVCPVQTGFVNCADPDVSGGVNIFYNKQGNCAAGQPTIVFIHGLNGSESNWACQQALLCQQFCTVALDLRGFGQSSKPTGVADYTLAKMTQDVICVINALGITNPIIVGHSLGGIIAINLGVMDVASQLVLVDTSANSFPPFSSVTPQGLNFTLFVEVGDLIALGDFAAAATLTVNTIFNEACTSNPVFNTFIQDAIALFTVTFETAGPAGANILTNIAFGDYNFTQVQVQSISVPTLIIHGQIDEVFPGVQASIYLRENIPNSFMVEFRGKGHAPFFTDMWRFNQTLTDFVTNNDLNCAVCLTTLL